MPGKLTLLRWSPKIEVRADVKSVPNGTGPNQPRVQRSATLGNPDASRGQRCLLGEEHRPTGASPVVAAYMLGWLLAGSNARRGYAPSWRARRWQKRL